MAFIVLLLISSCLIHNVFTKDKPDCNLERAELERYVENLVETKLGEKAASRDKEMAILKERLQHAERRYQEQRSIIEALSKDKMPPMSPSKRNLFPDAGSPIGFMACVSPPDLVNLGDKHIILFDKVITNTGGAYHGHTGIFIAPTKGLYEFYLTAMSMPGKHQYLSFVKDGTVISYLYPDAYSSSASVETAGNQWVVELDQGSEVWIQTYVAGEIHGNCFTTFSGFLISEME